MCVVIRGAAETSGASSAPGKAGAVPGPPVPSVTADPPRRACAYALAARQAGVRKPGGVIVSNRYSRTLFVVRTIVPRFVFRFPPARASVEHSRRGSTQRLVLRPVARAGHGGGRARRGGGVRGRAGARG